MTTDPTHEEQTGEELKLLYVESVGEIDWANYSQVDVTIDLSDDDPIILRFTTEDAKDLKNRLGPAIKATIKEESENPTWPFGDKIQDR